jgi:hypothetical protein
MKTLMLSVDLEVVNSIIDKSRRDLERIGHICIYPWAISLFVGGFSFFYPPLFATTTSIVSSRCDQLEKGGFLVVTPIFILFCFPSQAWLSFVVLFRSSFGMPVSQSRDNSEKRMERKSFASIEKNQSGKFSFLFSFFSYFLLCTRVP